MQGKIIKSIAGFYEVHCKGEIYRCRAKGILRALHQKPLVGDNVDFTVTDMRSCPPEGNINSLFPRKNALIRPNVANADQALLVFAVTYPQPSYQMLDRFLIAMSQRELPAVLCFNKKDLSTEEERRELQGIYESCGCRVIFISTRERENLHPLRELLKGKTTVLAGPSGVGKSTLINTLCGISRMETGELSRKIERGKNTTRHVELLAAGEDTYLVDTPGFTSLYLEGIPPEELSLYYPEFTDKMNACRFTGCMHIHEPDCAVKEAVEDGRISRIRYNNYCELYAELKDQKVIYNNKK